MEVALSIGRGGVGTKKSNRGVTLPKEPEPRQKYQVVDFLDPAFLKSEFFKLVVDTDLSA